MDIVFRTRNGQVLEDYWNKLVDVFGIEDIPLIVEAVAERRAFPPCRGVDATPRKYREASFDGADGVVAHQPYFRIAF
jgi:hypothetical protein